MALPRLPLLLSLLALSFFVQASASNQGLLSCASNCLAAPLDEVLCHSTDPTCVCSNERLQRNLTRCAIASCPIPEALSVLNDSFTTCGNTARDRSQQYTGITLTMAALAAVFVIMRFVYKLFARMELRPDDWVVLATLVILIAMLIISICGMSANGMGRDIWTVTPDKLSSFAFYFYLGSNFYLVAITLNKEAMILFFIYIFPAQELQRLLRVTAVVIGAQGLAFTIVNIFQCHPVQYSWARWTGESEGSCVYLNVVGWLHSATSVALDIWMLGIPLWQLRHLQLHWKKKISVAVMFCVGAFVTVISILRFQSLILFARSPNVTWDNYDISIWSMVELSVGVICTCLPVFRLLLFRLFPALSGSLQRDLSHQHQHQYPSNGRFTSALDRSHRVNTVTATRLPSGDSTDTRSQGILFQKSFVVEYGDSDEISLVHEMSDISPARDGRAPKG